MRDPLILPLAAIISGIVAGRQFGFVLHEALWPSVALALLALLAKTKLIKYLALTLSLFFVGAMLEAWHLPGPTPTIDAGPRETMLLEGCVVDPTVFSEGREQFTLELDPGARARVTLGLRDGDLPQQLNYGQRVEIEARIRPPHNYNNPGSFDYAGYLAGQKIYWTASMTRGSSAKILSGRCGSRAMAAIFALRTRALAAIDRLYPDTKTAGLMQAILLGESSKLQKIWTEDFRRTGTYHALVISGIHVTVLAGVLLFFLRVCLLPELAALTIAAAGAWLYALVSGMSAPVVRAAGGFTLYLIARFFFRRGRVLNLLAAIALVCLIWDPDQLFDASFQLSFLCVAAIGALAMPLIDATTGPLSRATRSPTNIDIDPHLEPRTAQFRVELRLIAETIALWTRIPVRWASEALALAGRLTFFACEMILVSAVIQIGLVLPMIEYFHRVSLSGLSANLLVAPLLNGVVPIGFFAVFTGWHWPAAIAAMLLRWAGNVAEWHARFEPAWRVSDPPWWLAISFVIALVLLALFRRRVLRLAALAAVLALFTILLWQPWPPAIAPHTLELTALDVGQGDSLLVVFPEGRTMLIDGGGLLQFGPRQRRSNLDTGEDVVSPYLWTRRIRRIDVIVATHAHEDHTGGLAAMLENFRPAEFWTGANPPQKLIDRAARIGTRVRELRRADPFPYAGTSVEVLSPPADYDAAKPGNNDSLAFRIRYGDRSFLLTGDMERPMEARLLRDETPLTADVLKIAHHGSRTSTLAPFLDAVAPSIAIISAGFQNSFGHPHPDVLARLAGRHAAVLRTDLDGLVTVRTDGRRLWFETARLVGQAGSLRRVVNPPE
jgi:competence protein ComEC